MKDLYAGRRTSATASLKDSLNSLSGTVHWDCLWWISSNWMLKVLNLSFTIALEIPMLLPSPPIEPLLPDEPSPWTERHCRICSQVKKIGLAWWLADYSTKDYVKVKTMVTASVIKDLETNMLLNIILWWSDIFHTLNQVNGSTKIRHADHWISSNNNPVCKQ